MNVSIPLFILLAVTLIMHLREQWGVVPAKSGTLFIAGIVAALGAISFIGFGGAFENRYIVDRFALTLSVCALGASLLFYALRPSFRDTIQSHDLLAIAGIVAAAGAQDFLLLFAGLSVSILSLTRPSRLSFATRLFSSPIMAIAALGLGLALIVALSGTTKIVDARISIGVLQVNHRGDIGLILIPALILMFGAFLILLAPPRADQWLRRSIRMVTAGDALTLALWPLIILVLFARLFVGVLFAFSDPVMTPNDWGIGMSILLGVCMIAVMLAGREEKDRDSFLFRAWQFQLLMIPIGLMAVTSSGLASSLSLVVVATLNTILLSLIVTNRSKEFSWPSLAVAAAMIGFPGVAGFFVRLATLDAAVEVSGLKLSLTILLAVQFSVVAVFCTFLVRRSGLLIRASRIDKSAELSAAQTDFSRPQPAGIPSGLIIAVVLGVIVVSSLLTPTLLATLTPAGEMFGLTLK